MKFNPYGLAGVLRASLGARWDALHPDIRARFTLAPRKTRQSFAGTMNEIDRSTIGWLCAKLIAFVRILPAQRARGVPFEFNLSPAPGHAPGSAWIKQRLYRFRGDDFEFRSVMRFTREGELVEQFPFGLGMKIKLGVEGNNGDTLTFNDDGYFLRIGQRRLPLPRWLSVGRFSLAHKNIDCEKFSVEISIDHPLFGQLFYQYGEFQEVPARTRACAPAAPRARTLTPSRQPSV